MKLKFTNYRNFTKIEDMTELELKQYYYGRTYNKKLDKPMNEVIEFVKSTLEEGIQIQFVDVADEADKIIYQFCMDWDGGGTLHSNGEIDLIAKACQHSIEYCPTKELWDALGEAKATSKNMDLSVDFDYDEEDEDCFTEEK